jgi:NADH-quinone oxidoreductase subunit M
VGQHHLSSGLSGLLPLALQFNPARTSNSKKAAWIPSLGASYHLGIDGLSLLLVMLTTLIGFIAVLSSWNAIHERLKEYYAFFLVLQTGMLGVFMSLDFLLFFVFWESVLVPMYFIIALWGGQRRGYASIKFMIYTLAGSVLMFLGIIYLFTAALLAIRTPSFDIAELMRTQVPAGAQWWVFWAFFVGFAVKVPMFPFHTWLPDAHTEAPTAGSVILASVLLKMGTYGFLRFSIPAAARRRQEPQNHPDCLLPLDRRHRVRRAGVAHAEGLEEAGGLFVGEPPGLLYARHFRAQSGRHFRFDSAADQPRHFHRHALPDRRRGV